MAHWLLKIERSRFLVTKGMRSLYETVIQEDAVSHTGRSTNLICSYLCDRRAKLVLVFLGALILGIGQPGAAFAETEATNALSAKLAGMSIEQLVNVEVVSINSLFKKETRLDQAPAAVSLVTSDDIRRLGITTIPEALRLVPGMDVARIDSHEWAISARGFDAQFANKLLILEDGRTIYGPAYGGVNWGMQDVMMEDLDRIEVIRGPGASLWGANAVNGVVNILSKSARDTQGFLASSTGGTEDQPGIAARYGGQLGTNLYYRVYGKYFDRDGLVTSTGADANDDWNSIQGGTRLDWEPSDESKFTFQGNYYNDIVHENQNVVLLTPPFGTNTLAENHDYGGYALGRWTRQFSESSALTLQTYYDHFRQQQVGSVETRNSFDFDGQYRVPIGERNDVIAGFQYYLTSDNFPPNFFLTWTPPVRNDQLFSAFVQDEITLLPERLTLTLGSKFEHNDYTGFEAEPNVRLLWTPADNQTVWAAVSRAIRTPSRYETGARVNYSVFEQPDSTITINRLLGNDDAQSEKLNAYEMGYRIQPTKRLSFDLAGFYNQYDDLLRFVTNGQGFMQGPIEILPQSIKNSGSAETFGGELYAEWKALDNWRLAASYSLLHADLHPNDRAFQGNPQQMFKMTSYLDLTPNLEFNGALYYMDQQTAEAGLSTATIPSYVRLDVGMVWRPRKWMEVGLWGQNLLQDRHAEFPSLKSSVQTEIPREVLGKITLKF